MKKLPVYEMLIDEADESDLMVDFIALVDKPATQKLFRKFNEEFINPSKGEHKTEFLPRCISYVINEGKESEQAVAICNSLWDEHFAVKPVTFAIQDEEQRIISGPLMVANQRIYRIDSDGFEYQVYFSPATIKKIAIKMAKKGFQNNVNLMHDSDMQLSGVTLFEIFQSDKERGIMPMKGFEDLADGSLFGSMYVDNDEAWQLIKEGKVKGFSVEGNFGMRSKDKYEEQMAEIISILSETNFDN
jgi:hypothetical protein